MGQADKKVSKHNSLRSTSWSCLQGGLIVGKVESFFHKARSLLYRLGWQAGEGGGIWAITPRDCFRAVGFWVSLPGHFCFGVPCRTGIGGGPDGGFIKPVLLFPWGLAGKGYRAWSLFVCIKAVG